MYKRQGDKVIVPAEINGYGRDLQAMVTEIEKFCLLYTSIGLVFLIFKEGILLLKHLTLIEGYFSLLKLTSSPLEISTN